MASWKLPNFVEMEIIPEVEVEVKQRDNDMPWGVIFLLFKWEF